MRAMARHVTSRTANSVSFEILSVGHGIADEARFRTLVCLGVELIGRGRIAVLIVRTGTSLAQLEMNLRPSGPMSNARKCLQIFGLFGPMDCDSLRGQEVGIVRS